MSSNKAQHLIELKNVKKEFDGTVVLENFNLYINDGEFVTFLGPSGCGKTTTLRMIAGFDIPTSGEILLNGEDITKLPPRSFVEEIYGLDSQIDEKRIRLIGEGYERKIELFRAFQLGEDLKKRKLAVKDYRKPTIEMESFIIQNEDNENPSDL